MKGIKFWLCVVTCIAMAGHLVSTMEQCVDLWKSGAVRNKSPDTCKVVQKVGHLAGLYCDVDSSLTVISWYRKNGSHWVQIQPNQDGRNSEQNIYFSDDKRNLTIVSAYSDYQGTYRCVAKYPDKINITQTMELELYECSERSPDEPVYVHVTPREFLTDIGSSIQSSCVADYSCGTPGPYKAGWYMYLKDVTDRVKVEVADGLRYLVSYNHSNAGKYINATLTIKEIQEVDFERHFVCLVTNASNTTAQTLQIKKMKEVIKKVPYHYKRVLVPVLIPVMLLIFLVTLCWRYRKIIRRYRKSHFGLAQNGVNNKVFIIFNDEEERDQSTALYLDRELAQFLEHQLSEDGYEVTLLDCCIGKYERNEINDRFKEFSVVIVILPDLENTEKFHEFNNCAMCAEENGYLNFRFFTVINRPDEEMGKCHDNFQHTLLLSKGVVHLRRPDKKAEDEERQLFYQNLKKERIPPLPILPEHVKDDKKFDVEIKMHSCLCWRKTHVYEKVREDLIV